MKQSTSFSFRKRIRSFGYAWQGIVALVRHEHNARIHIVAAIFVIILGFVLGVSTLEWVAIVGCIGAVIAAEIFNTAIEAICNRVSTENHELIKRSKDCAAGGVLLISITAAIIGAIIFLPKLWYIVQ